MITYPCYVTTTDNDCADEDDQCTEKRVLYDPRIKSVSSNFQKLAGKFT